MAKRLAGPARMRPRHWVAIVSFGIMVVLPAIVAAMYLYSRAEDQYASTVGFTVRSNERGAATDLLGGLSSLAGGGGSGTDADIIHEFILSQELVQRLDQDLDLRGHFAQHHDSDPFYGLVPGATMEELMHHWSDVVRISYDQTAGLIEIRVMAFDPLSAQRIAQAIITQSQILVNDLNANARADAISFAEADLEVALGRLRSAREALTAFRTRTQIVDPESDLQGRMGVLNNLQQQLAEALIDYDLLSENTGNPNDPRLLQSLRRIEVIRSRISEERQNFTLEDIGSAGEDYPTLMAEYEGLVVDREFAEESYRAALTALDVARTNATRQSRYLAVFVNPTLPESAEFPRRSVSLSLLVVFLCIGWSIAVLVAYAIRDRQ